MISKVLLYTLSAEDGCLPHAVGEQRPAMVVRVFGGATKLYNVQVLTDGTNDFPAELPGGNGRFWKGSVSIADAPTEGCLSWPMVECVKQPTEDVITENTSEAPSETPKRGRKNRAS